MIMIASAFADDDNDRDGRWSGRATKVEVRSGQRSALVAHRKNRDKSIRLTNAGVDIRGRKIK